MTKITPQPGIMDIALYVGGKSHVDGVSNVVKLSSNENPFGPSPAAQEAVRRSVLELHRYPSTNHAALRAAIAEVHNLNADQIICGVGSDEIITFLCQAYAGPGDEVIHTEHGFALYKICALAAGATPVEVAEHERVTDVDAILAACTDKTKLVFIANPNNPTGTVATKETLKQWVNYARENDAIIFFDAAYEAFITDPEIPHSIYEVEGAKEVAIEFRSFSKNAGFTGTRCAFTVVPKELKGKTSDGTVTDIHPLWNRRHCTKFNGVSYIIQRGAEAAYSAEGKEQIQGLIKFYLENAKLLSEGLEAVNIKVYGGVNAPYVWLQTPGGMSSWDFFDKLLQQAHLVGTPGSGFGASGEGYFRLSAFNSRANVEEAVARFQKVVS